VRKCGGEVSEDEEKQYSIVGVGDSVIDIVIDVVVWDERSGGGFC